MNKCMCRLDKVQKSVTDNYVHDYNSAFFFENGWCRQVFKWGCLFMNVYAPMTWRRKLYIFCFFVSYDSELGLVKKKKKNTQYWMSEGWIQSSVINQQTNTSQCLQTYNINNISYMTEMTKLNTVCEFHSFSSPKTEAVHSRPGCRFRGQIWERGQLWKDSYGNLWRTQPTQPYLPPCTDSWFPSWPCQPAGDAVNKNLDGQVMFHHLSHWDLI